jgi:GcrA cell cycle regulator
MAFPWTDEHLETVKRLFSEKKSATQIANAMGHGLSRNAICGKLARLGLTRGAEKHVSSAPKPRSEPRVKMVSVKPAAPRRASVVPIAMIDAADVIPLLISLVDLEPKSCRWPYGDGPIFLFCGHPVLDAPYCFGHMQLSLNSKTHVYLAPEERKRRSEQALANLELHRRKQANAKRHA